MAYRFNGSSDLVEFALAPFTGASLGPFTVAALLRRGTTTGTQTITGFTNSGGTMKFRWVFSAGNMGIDTATGGMSVADFTTPGTTLWYIAAVTAANPTVDLRFHHHNETAWTHDSIGFGVGATSLASGDRFRAGVKAATEFFNGDIVCLGIKKADSSDAAIQTLSRTSFDAWRTFAFDWLIGFDSSLVSGGALQDQASPGTGDQIAITGTTLVSDPPGWAWTSVVTPVADFTATPLTGVAPLSVAFTDTSSNTPTSWAWTFGDGGTSSSQNPTHSYTAAGTYTVVLVATNAAGSNTKTRTGYVSVAAGFVPKITWIN